MLQSSAASVHSMLVVRNLTLGLIAAFVLSGLACAEKYAERCGHECKANGRCTGISGQKCVATSDGDCQRAENCTAKGMCGLAEGKCVVTAAGCAASAYCHDKGLCSVAGDRCAAVTPPDCARTESCKHQGRCTPQNGECVPTKPDCEKIRDCTQFGKCSPLDYNCSTVTSADCKLSELCKEQGYCTFQNGGCALLSDEDCKQTRLCRDEGRCYFQAVEANKGLPQAGCFKRSARGR